MRTRNWVVLFVLGILVALAVWPAPVLRWEVTERIGPFYTKTWDGCVAFTGTGLIPELTSSAVGYDSLFVSWWAVDICDATTQSIFPKAFKGIVFGWMAGREYPPLGSISLTRNENSLREAWYDAVVMNGQGEYLAYHTWRNKP